MKTDVTDSKYSFCQIDKKNDKILNFKNLIE